jgi:hypothetical protein
MSTSSQTKQPKSIESNDNKPLKNKTAVTKLTKKSKAEPLDFTDDQLDIIARIFQDKAGVAARAANLGFGLTIIIGIVILAAFVATGLISSISHDAPGISPTPALETVSGVVGFLIIRVGAVIIGVFVMQVMIHFVRYNMRMYFHWSMCSSLIKLSRGNHLIINDLAHTLNPSSIDFGKAPVAPTEKMIDGAFGALKELAKKIPSRN